MKKLWVSMTKNCFWNWRTTEISTSIIGFKLDHQVNLITGDTRVELLV